VLAVAVTGTVFIALGAFWLSFTSLSALARRCGIPADRAWVWPLIVDGVIVVATVSVVAMTGGSQDRRAVRYPWLLLLAGACVSVLANASHAVVAANASVPSVVAALVAAVPPVVLVAITHLTVELTHRPATASATATAGPERSATARRATGSTTTASDRGAGGTAGEAVRLRAQTTLTNREIAARLGVHPSTVGRWLKAADAPELPALPTGRALAVAGGQPTTSAERSPE
jgi:DNA-binding transcriptional regulator YiaG